MINVEYVKKKLTRSLPARLKGEIGKIRRATVETSERLGVREPFHDMIRDTKVGLSSFYLRRPSLWKRKIALIDQNIAISKEHQFVCIMMPKCGSSSMAVNLDYYFSDPNQATSEPRPAEDARRSFTRLSDLHSQEAEDTLERSFIFTVARNPFHRILSAYLDKFRLKKYQIRYGPKIKKYGDDVTFFTFCRWLEDGGFQENHHFLPQSHFVDVIGFENLDFIGKLESFERDVQKIFSLIDESRTEFRIYRGEWRQSGRHKETKSRKKNESYYDLESIDIVRHIYHSDFEYFGYSPDLK